MNKKKIIIENNIDELHTINKELEKLKDKWNIGTKQFFNINLVIEEIITNIIMYAFKDHKKHLIDIELFKEEKSIKVKICDEGMPFNPLKKETSDEINKTSEERKIGGLGIHFAKNLMEKIEYKRENNKNILTLIKESKSV